MNLERMASNGSNLVIAIFLFIISVAISYNAFNERYRSTRQPLNLISMEVETPVISPGEDIAFILTYTRSFYCRSDVTQVLDKDSSDGVETAVLRDRIPVGVSDENVIQKRRWLFHTPKTLAPGNYTLRQLYHSDCGDYVHTLLLPPIKVEVAN